MGGNENKALSTLLFLCFLFIGADRFSVVIGGFTFRFVQVLLIIYLMCAIMIYRPQLQWKSIITFLPFLITHIVASLFSYSFIRSIGYIVWVLMNFYFVFLPASMAVNTKNWFMLFLKSFEVVGVIILIQFVIGIAGFEIPLLYTNFYAAIPRPSVWFYEPSYLATYLTIFLAISGYLYFQTNSSRYFWQTVRACIYIIFTTSATGIIGVFVTFLFLFLSTRTITISKKIKILTIITLGVGILFILFYKTNPMLYNLVVGRFFSGDLNAASGGRIEGWTSTFEIILENIWFGIGPGAYVKIFGWPPTNVALELLVSVGLVGFIAGILWFASPFLFSQNQTKTEKALLFSYVVFLVTLQANQNYLRLYHWLLMGLLSGVQIKKQPFWREKNETND